MKNAIINLMNEDNYSNDKRQNVLDKVQEFMKSDAHTSILGVCLKQCGLSIGNLTKLLAIITNGLHLLPSVVKKLDDNGRKYLLYAILYSFILDEAPAFFDNTLSISEFNLLFNGAYALLLIIPSSIAKVGKFCC